MRVGTSGYQYNHWKGLFYPDRLPKKEWFALYAEHFDTVEINNSFYRLPEASVFASWRSAAPPGFLYALKFSRFATHMKKLLDPEEPLEKFVGRASMLEATLGPVLVQLPPRWTVNLARLRGFLAAAPREIRWAIEFRERSWLHEDTFALLREFGAALCLHDMMPHHPEVLTAPWTYLRYHGNRYAGSYSAADLAREAERIDGWLRQGTDVYAYFNNDIGGHAVTNARDLRNLIAAGFGSRPTATSPARPRARAPRRGRAT